MSCYNSIQHFLILFPLSIESNTWSTGNQSLLLFKQATEGTPNMCLQLFIYDLYVYLTADGQLTIVFSCVRRKIPFLPGWLISKLGRDQRDQMIGEESRKHFIQSKVSKGYWLTALLNVPFSSFYRLLFQSFQPIVDNTDTVDHPIIFSFACLQSLSVISSYCFQEHKLAGAMLGKHQ